MHDIPKRKAGNFLWRVAERLEPCSIRVEEAALRGDRLDEVAGILEQVAVALLAFHQGGFGKFTLGDVADYQERLPIIQRHSPRFPERRFVSLGLAKLKGMQLSIGDSLTHLLKDTFRILWQEIEIANIAPDKLVWRQIMAIATVPKRTITADDEHHVRHGTKQGLVTLLARAQRRLGLLAFRNITGDSKESADVIVCITQRSD